MRITKMKILGSFVIILIMLLPLQAIGSYEEVDVTFSHQNNILTGSVIIPKKKGPFPVVIFVHGDGAMPYDAHGYYRYLWKSLAEKGIASFAWNKPGVGDSTGDWERQSMNDRADEVIAAIDFLKGLDEIQPNKIGLIGYSQAGWVLPLVASKSVPLKLMVIVSGAINWMEQGNYLIKTRMKREGLAPKEISEAIKANVDIAKLFSPELSYEEYIHLHNDRYRGALKRVNPPMSESRFRFAKLNWRYDARALLRYIDCPTLAIFGEKDQNIDISNSIQVYQAEFMKSGNDDLEVRVYSSAQHGILRDKSFGDISPGLWFMIKLEFLGKEAFAESYLEYVSEWIYEKLKRI